jgi:hypothetical protein
MTRLPFHRCVSVGFVLVVLCSYSALSQDPTTGSVEVTARVRIDGKQAKFARKSFYLLRGGLQDNKPILDRIKTTEITSRDCYYARLKASPAFICWLDAENCDSPYCRKIETDEIEAVPEFKAAYQKGLLLFGQKTDIAQQWLASNLAPALTGGFHREQQGVFERLLGGAILVKSAMTDAVTFKSTFVDIPVTVSEEKPVQMFTVSNITPFEFSGKSYVWSCQVEVSPEKLAVVRLIVPEGDKPVRNCEIVVKALKVCRTGTCGQQ